MAKVLFDLGAAFLAPLFLDRVIIVVGQERTPREVYVRVGQRHG